MLFSVQCNHQYTYIGQNQLMCKIWKNSPNPPHRDKKKAVLYSLSLSTNHSFASGFGSCWSIKDFKHKYKNDEGGYRDRRGRNGKLKTTRGSGERNMEWSGVEWREGEASCRYCSSCFSVYPVTVTMRHSQFEMQV